MNMHTQCTYRVNSTSLQWAASPVYVSTETLISPVRVGSLLGLDQDDCCSVDEGLANWEVLGALWWQCDHFLGICCKQCASGHHQVVEQRLVADIKELFIYLHCRFAPPASCWQKWWLYAIQPELPCFWTNWMTICTYATKLQVNSQSVLASMRENSTLTSASY